jgi:hypothetical protein
MPRPRTSEVRKAIPDRVKVLVLLRMLKLDPADVEWDHDPALGLRPFSTVTGDFIPPQLDPAGIVARPRRGHAEKTFGPGGERRITTLGSDIHAIAKVKRLARGQAAHDARRNGEAAPAPQRRKRKIPSRPFSKRHRPMRRRKPTAREADANRGTG